MKTITRIIVAFLLIATMVSGISMHTGESNAYAMTSSTPVVTDSETSSLYWTKTTYDYRAVKVEDLPKKLSTEPFGSIKASPGITISLTSTKSITRTYTVTANIGVEIEELNASIGWSKAKADTVSVTNAASWTVPSKVNGKRIKYGYLKGYVYLDRVRYKIMRQKVVTYYFKGTIIPFKVVKYAWEDYKTGVATKARTNDIVYKKTYTYQ